MAAFLAGCAVFVAAGYSAYQVAPAAAEPPSSFGGHFLATLWFLPRVLFWQPTWGVAALFALSGGERGSCWLQRRLSHALHVWPCAFGPASAACADVSHMGVGVPPALQVPHVLPCVRWTMPSGCGAGPMLCPVMCTSLHSWPPGTRCCGAAAAAAGAPS